MDKWGFLYKVEVDDSGVRDWINKMMNESVVAEAIDEGVDKIARETANEIARGAPVDTGHLKSTLWASRSIKNEGKGVRSMKNYTPYGIRQNFEHSTQRYFMTTPIEKAEARMMSEIYAAVLKAIE